MPANKVSEFITTAEAAKMLGVSQRWIQKLVKKGDLPSYRPGRRWLKIRRREFEAYIAHQKASLLEVVSGTDGLIAPDASVTTADVIPPPATAGTIVVDLTQFNG